MTSLADSSCPERLIRAWAKVCMLAMVVFTGCNSFHLNKTRLEPTPEVFQATPGQQDLMQLVNQRSQRVQELQAQVSVSMTGVPARLNGTLVVQRPRNLRLKISPLGVDSLGADVGSNADEFWVWIKSAGAAGSAMMHARHDEFAVSPNAQQVPMDPQWLLDSLGLITFLPNRQYHGPTVKDGMLVIQETESTFSGPRTSVLTFEPKTGLLIRKTLYDAAGNIVGYCDLSRHQYVPGAEAAIPTQVKIVFQPFTQAETTAEIQLTNITLNGLYVDTASAFQMPHAVGVQKIDLAKTVLRPAQLKVQPTGYPTSGSGDAANGSSGLFRGATLWKNPFK